MSRRVVIVFDAREKASHHKDTKDTKGSLCVLCVFVVKTV
jgi:hypothetical protein